MPSPNVVHTADGPVVEVHGYHELDEVIKACQEAGAFNSGTGKYRVRLLGAAHSDETRELSKTEIKTKTEELLLLSF